MPTLTGSITGVTGESIDPDQLRRVFVRAPVKRASLAVETRLVSTVPVKVDATGEISLHLEPGPAVLVVESLYSADVYDLYVTSDMTLLTEAVAEVAAEERPWIESVMVQLRQDAVAAAADAALSEGAAADSATAASGHKDDAETAAGHVQTDHAHIHLDVTQADVHAAASAASAVVAGTKQGQANTSASTAAQKATQAGQSAADALLYRNTASGAATTATTQAGIATTGATTATTKAGEASVSAQTLSSRISNGGLEVGYYQGRPYLLETAVVGVPLTVDNTVGTRVMLGSTMLAGDTGWRNVSALKEPDSGGTAAGLFVRRVGQVVTFRAVNPVGLSGTFLKLPNGVRGTPSSDIPLGVTGTGSTTIRLNWASSLYLLDPVTVTGAGYGAVAQWVTSDPWPTSLPGTPA